MNRYGIGMAAVALAALAGWGAGPLSLAQTRPAVESSGDVFPDRDTYINFSFDQVDIRTFAKLVGGITDKRFTVAEDVDGQITVVSPKIRPEEAFPLFVSILESSGCSVMREGDVYRIVKLPAGGMAIAPVVGVHDHMPADGIVTKVFRVEHIPVSELRRLLEPKVRGGKLGAVGAIDETNHLVVTDTAASIRQIEKIIRELDQPGLANVTEVVQLMYADAENLARELNATMEEGESRAERLRQRLPAAAPSPGELKRRAFAVPSPHSNSLLLVGAASQIEELKRVIALMDVDTPTGRGRLNAIFLKYLQAEDAAVSLKALLGKAPDGTETPRAKPRDVNIEADAANNALLVDATPGDFDVVKRLIEQLDRMPEQVHIEVVIAEMSVGENVDIGVTMAAIDMPSKPGDSVVQGASTVNDDTSALLNILQNGIFPGGLTVGVAHGTRLDAEGNVVVGFPGLININAVKRDTRFKIRSNPSLMVQNNKEASVSIVNEIPILTSTIEGGSGTARDVIQNIERMDVGIKLTLTPHIIPGGEVRMVLNPSIEAVIDQGPVGTQFTPTIAKREVSTTVTVPDGEMIVIAGLTREDNTSIVRRIPLLGSMPIVGWLFRRTVEGVEKTNVLIFVTPTIVRNAADATAVMEGMSRQSGISGHAREE